MSCTEKDASVEVSILSRPNTTVVNSNYLGNRAPLKPLSFIKLPVGDIKPEGWLKKYLLLQKEGLTGKLGEISAWLDKKRMLGCFPEVTTDGRKCLIG